MLIGLYVHMFVCYVVSSDSKRRIAVVGAGPAGLAFATSAAGLADSLVTMCCDVLSHVP